MLQFCLLILIWLFFWPLFYFIMLYLDKGLIFQSVSKTHMRMWHITNQEGVFCPRLLNHWVSVWLSDPYCQGRVYKCICVYWWEESRKTEEGPSVKVLQGDEIGSFVFSGSRSSHNTRTIMVTTLIFRDLPPVAGCEAFTAPHSFHTSSQKKERHYIGTGLWLGRHRAQEYSCRKQESLSLPLVHGEGSDSTGRLHRHGGFLRYLLLGTIALQELEFSGFWVGGKILSLFSYLS